MICQDQQRITRGHRHLSQFASHASFRIQVQDADWGTWRMYANFSFRGEAEACLDALRLRGIEARMLLDGIAESAK